MPTYKKAMSRRSRALAQLKDYKLALEDITAVVMLDEFKNQPDILFADFLTKNLCKIVFPLFNVNF